MRCWLNIPVRVLLIIIVAIVAIPAAVIIIYSEIQYMNHSLEHARIDTLNLVEMVESEQRILVSSIQQLLITLAQLPEINEKDVRGTTLFLNKILKLHPDFLNIILADRNGRVWASALPYSPNVTISDRRYFKNAILTGHMSTGDFHIGRISKRPSFNVGYPYRGGDGKISGVITVAIDLDEYSKVLRFAQIPRGSNLLLLDYKGTVLFSGTDREMRVGKPFDLRLFEEMQSGPDVDTKVTGAAGGSASQERYISYQKVRLNEESLPYMYVVVSISARPIVTEVDRQIAIKMSQLLMILALALIFSWIVGKRGIADRIDLLEGASKRLAEGDGQIRVSQLVQGGELGRLAASFDNMAEQLASRETLVLQRKQELKKAQELAKLGSWKFDVDGSLSWSDELYRIFDVPKESFVVSKDSFLNLVDPRDRDPVIAWIEACKAGQNPGELVFRTILPDGTVKFITGRGELTSDSEGRTTMSGTAQDITARKQAEQLIIEKQHQLEELNQHLELRVSETVSELRKKDEILIRQNRQAAMGETIGYVAHQWRQPLNTLGLIVQGIKMTYGSDEFTKESLEADVDRAMQLISHMSKTIEYFQNFFRPNNVRSQFSVNAAVAHTLSLIMPSLISSNIETQVTENDLVQTYGYSNEYSQVLINILNNCKDAFAGSVNAIKRIVITVFRENNRSVVTIEDNAGGIPDDVIDKIFDPYFTTKGPDKGTGIGLYMAKNIIEKHMDGKLTARNVVGGAEFRVEV